MQRLPLCFQELDYKLAMSILDPKINYLDHEPLMSSNCERSMLMKLIISADDLKLLRGICQQLQRIYKGQGYGATTRSMLFSGAAFSYIIIPSSIYLALCKNLE